MHKSIEKLIKSYNEDPEWKEILPIIGACPAGEETTVDEVFEALQAAETEDDWSRRDVVTCFKEFEELGFATMIKGVKSKKTRLDWMFPPRVVAAAAMGEPEELQSLMAGTPVVAASLLGEFKDKTSWRLEEVREALSQIAGVPAGELEISITIPEARQLLAAGQGISPDEVQVRMG